MVSSDRSSSLVAKPTRSPTTIFSFLLIGTALAAAMLRPVEAMICETSWDIELVETSDPDSIASSSDSGESGGSSATWITSGFSAFTVYGPDKDDDLGYELDAFHDADVGILLSRVGP